MIDNTNMEAFNENSSYSYVTKKFHCHACNNEFTKMIKSDEGAVCDSCNSEFVEEITRNNHEEVTSFRPERGEAPQRQERPSRAHAHPTITVTRRRIVPGGMFITETVTSGGDSSSSHGDFFGLPEMPFMRRRRNPFEGFFTGFDSFMGPAFPTMGGMGGFNINDILEASFREARTNGVPPASDEAIAGLKEVSVKEGEHKCPI